MFESGEFALNSYSEPDEIDLEYQDIDTNFDVISDFLKNLEPDSADLTLLENIYDYLESVIDDDTASSYQHSKAHKLLRKVNNVYRLISDATDDKSPIELPEEPSTPESYEILHKIYKLRVPVIFEQLPIAISSIIDFRKQIANVSMSVVRYGFHLLDTEKNKRPRLEENDLRYIPVGSVFKATSNLDSPRRSTDGVFLNNSRVSALAATRIADSENLTHLEDGAITSVRKLPRGKSYSFIEREKLGNSVVTLLKEVLNNKILSTLFSKAHAFAKKK